MPKALPKSPILAKLPLACSDESAAVAFMEEQRGWIAEPSCPKCGVVGECYPMNAKKKDGSPRFVWRCKACEGQYTVKTGTIMEDSPVPVYKWCRAFWLASSAKKGISAKQIERTLEVTYKTALFMMHRIRWAMKPANENGPKLGVGGGTVEFDETYVGGKPRNIRERWARLGKKPKLGPAPDFKDRKTPVIAGLERGGMVKAQVVTDLTRDSAPEQLFTMVDGSAHLRTDESAKYTRVGAAFASHETVNHKKGQYVKRGDYAGGKVTTNTIEGFFAGLKRQVGGTHHSVSRKHLHRYVTEVCYKYNTRNIDDGERTVRAIQAAVGRRLTYADQVGK